MVSREGSDKTELCRIVFCVKFYLTNSFSGLFFNTNFLKKTLNDFKDYRLLGVTSVLDSLLVNK